MIDNRSIHKLSRKIKNAAGARGVLAQCSDESLMQEVQVSALSGEVFDGVERAQNYGFTSHPVGGEAFMIFVGGERGHPVIVALDDRKTRKIGLAAGEVAIYQANGDFIHLKNDNEIEIQSKKLIINASESVEIKTKKLSVEASESIDLTTLGSIGMETPSLSGAVGTFDLAGTEGGSSSANFNGSFSATKEIKSETDVKGAGISLKEHIHQETGNITEKPRS